MILNLSKKITDSNNIKHLSDKEIKYLIGLLYNDAFLFSIGYYTDKDTNKYKDSLFIHDSKELNELSFNQRVIDILKKLDDKYNEVIIETASKLTNDNKLKIKKELEKNYQNIYPIFKVNTNLVSGMKIYIDGTLLDKSFEHLLKQVKKESTKKDTSDLKGLKNFLQDLTNNLDELYNQEDTQENIGVIKSFKDGVIKVSGLKNIKMSEIIRVKETDSLALVMSLDTNFVYALVLSETKDIIQGMYVQSTSKSLKMPVSEDYLGRVIDSLGNILDGQGSVEPKDYFDHEKIAPGVITRQPVDEPLETGILAIDSLIPIGKGQRELIIGDRQTGKSTIAIDTIINQKDKDVICIYVAIAQRESFVANLYETFKYNKALEYTTIVSAPASTNAVNQFLAPYAATALAEYFMSKGKDVLIVYDDLSKHAVAYREISLLLRRPPGREAYPGDIFYIHSRLLERSARLNKDYGGGSITALPIIETQMGDVSAYIPTNVISITDGQIFLENDLFNKGILPAINVGISVSRVGSSAQYNVMKKTSGTIKLDLATYYELESFSQFSSDLDENTKKVLDRGKRIVLSLTQDQNKPYLLHQEIIILFAVINGFLDKIDESEITTKIKELVIYSNSQKDLISIINENKKYSDQVKDMLNKVCSEFFIDVSTD